MKRIRNDALKDALRAWAKTYSVIAPRRTAQGDCIFDDYDEASFTLDYKKPALPPKNSFLPQSEVIFQVEPGVYRQIILKQPTLLFGIRSCDLKGMLQSLSFMSGDLNDPYYSARAENTLSVVMACPGPQSPTCFCTSTRSGPSAEIGFDLQLYDD